MIDLAWNTKLLTYTAPRHVTIVLENSTANKLLTYSASRCITIVLENSTANMLYLHCIGRPDSDNSLACLRRHACWLAKSLPVRQRVARGHLWQGCWRLKECWVVFKKKIISSSCQLLSWLRSILIWINPSTHPLSPTPWKLCLGGEKMTLRRKNGAKKMCGKNGAPPPPPPKKRYNYRGILSWIISFPCWREITT